MVINCGKGLCRIQTEYLFAPKGARLAELQAFLSKQGLSVEEPPEFSVVVKDGGKISATASLCGDVIKYFAVDFEHRGSGVSAALLTEIKKYSFQNGISRLYLVTKPENRAMFEGLLFSEVAAAKSSVLMESPAGGIEDFLSTVRCSNAAAPIGAIVMNANPFTKGHRYLIETAAAQCGFVYVFVLSEEKSEFSAEERFSMVQNGMADLPNVRVVKTGRYLVSSATFPTYFLKDKSKAEEAFCDLDIAVFANRFIPALGITRRYVGTEPFCPTTAAYNAALAAALPAFGCKLITVPRLEISGEAISASRVRRLFAEGRDEEARKLLYLPQ